MPIRQAAAPVAIRQCANRSRRSPLLESVGHAVFVAAGQCVVDQPLHLRAAHVELEGRVQIRVVAPRGFGLGRLVFLVDETDFGIVLAFVLVPVAEDGGFGVAVACGARRGRGLGRRLLLAVSITA
jgi:hypothetical protein